MTHLPTHLARGLGAAAALVLTATACGGDDDTTTATVDGVELQSPGAESERARFPGTAEVGQQQAGTMDITSVIALGGSGMDQDVEIGVHLDYDAEIVEADESGAYASELTITGAELDGADAAASGLDLDDLAGVTMRQEFAADGTGGPLELANESELTSEQRAAYDAIAGDLAVSTVAFPAEEIGVGATWRTTVTLERQGFELPIVYEFELVELDGDDYTIEVAYDEDVDSDIEVDGQSATITGNVAGGGTIAGSTTAPLLTTTSMTQTMDVSIDADGQTVEMEMDIGVEIGVDGA